MTRASAEAPAADVAVVGGGPAGAWTAYRLARAGARVRLFDHTHPREKPCGGGVTGRALALVEPALGGALLPAVTIERARFEADGGGSAIVPLPALGMSPSTALLVTSRRAFDGALLDAAVAAGAELVGERVVDVDAGADGVSIRTEPGGRHRARWLIGADGANSLVRRRLSRPFARHQLSIATGVFARGRSSRDILIRFTSDPDGYLWSFPRPDHLAIGICAQADRATAAPLRARVRDWLEASAAAPGAPLEPYAWPIPTLAARDFDRERPAGARWMLVGDAAGLVDPITREGIFFALESADMAAASLTDVARDRTAAFIDRVRGGIVPELRRAALLKDGFFHGRVTRLVIDALERSAAIRSVMADLVAGRQPYAGLKRRLLGTFEVALAWRLLLLERGR